MVMKSLELTSNMLKIISTTFEKGQICQKLSKVWVLTAFS